MLAYALAILIACNRVPNLLDYPEYQDLRVQHPQTDLPASIAVVGTVGTDVMVKGPVTSHWDPKLILQLRRVRVNVENVLRGNLATGAVDVFYFTYGMSHDGNRILGNWTPGERLLMFLRKDLGVVRMACDGVASCATRVYSGFHPGLKADSGRPLEATLAELFLSKGTDLSDADFARVLETSSGNYNFACTKELQHYSYDYMKDQLLILGNSKAAPETREIACRLLFDDFQLGCDGKKLDQPPPSEPEQVVDPCFLFEIQGERCPDSIAKRRSADNGTTK